MYNSSKKIKKRKLHLFKENYTYLKTSWNVQTTAFFKNSTLHGVRYIAESDRPVYERLFWFICVLTGTIATISIIFSLWVKFQKSPTITGLDTDFHNWIVGFPAVTVCQDVPADLSNIENYFNSSKNTDFDGDERIHFLLDLTQLTFNRIPEFAKKYSQQRFIKNDTDIKQLVFGVMNKCENVLKSCEYLAEPLNCCENFYPAFTENGYCYTFNSKHYERKTSWSQNPPLLFKGLFIKETDLKWSLKFKSANEEVKMDIYILSPYEMAGLEIPPQLLWDYNVNRILFSLKKTYTTENAHQLSIKQRGCVFEHEMKLLIDDIYTYTSCARQCRMEQAMKKCGCVPYFYPEVAHFRHCRINEMLCIANNFDSIKSIERCNCYLGCTTEDFEVEKFDTPIDEDISNELETEFVSWPIVQYKREVIFGWVDLLVAFGGIAGLFLGFSLLSAVEILYYFTLRAFCMTIRDKKELKKIQISRNFKPKPAFDLSLVPYFVSEPLPGNGFNVLVDRIYQRKRNATLFRTKVLPLAQPTKLKISDTLIPPFGIEFVN